MCAIIQKVLTVCAGIQKVSLCVHPRESTELSEVGYRDATVLFSVDAVVEALRGFGDWPWKLGLNTWVRRSHSRRLWLCPAAGVGAGTDLSHCVAPAALCRAVGGGQQL